MCAKYELVGQKFNRLTVVEKTEERRNEQILWKCVCDCGNTRLVTSNQLLSGKVKQCRACRYKLVSDKMSTHREEPIDLWRKYICMKNRCYYKSYHAYNRYGGRGITVCDEWKESYEVFRDWALSHGYKPHLTLDRIDNDGNYCPENCRWVTMMEQNNNKSCNRIIEVYGEKDTLANWARKADVPYDKVYHRLANGENPDDVIGPLVKGRASTYVHV